MSEWKHPLAPQNPHAQGWPPPLPSLAYQVPSAHPCAYHGSPISQTPSLKSSPSLAWITAAVLRGSRTLVYAPHHLRCCQGVNPTKLPTFLLFQLSRWLLQGDVAPLSLAHKSTQDLLLFISPSTVHCRPGTPDSLGTWLAPTFSCLADTH